MDKTLVLVPRLSEKSYGLSKLHNTYVFEVPRNVNSHSVAAAVATQYSVTVTKVNLSVTKGKTKSTRYKRSRPVAGREAAIKKAYVTIKAGDHLPIFDAEEEATAKQEKTQEKLTKVAEKQAEKEAKPARHGLLHSKKESK